MMMAAAVGRQLGLGEDEIREGLASYVPTPMRMEVTRAGEHGEVTLINDAYNANPQSMKNALSILSGIARTPGMRKVAVLGDMLELGATEEQLHRSVGEAAAALDLDALVAVGPRGAWIARGAEDALAGNSGRELKVCAFARKEDARECLSQYLAPGAVLLFKGSRGMRMEQLWQYCRESLEGPRG
jgi:UDP-N-acetylmuramoyl-tripeptide--D-alanyl-D-alanine ligase